MANCRFSAQNQQFANPHLHDPTALYHPQRGTPQGSRITTPPVIYSFDWTTPAIASTTKSP
jgi:hypothetical protein